MMMMMINTLQRHLYFFLYICCAIAVLLLCLISVDTISIYYNYQHYTAKNLILNEYICLVYQ